MALLAGWRSLPMLRQPPFLTHLCSLQSAAFSPSQLRLSIATCLARHCRFTIDTRFWHDIALGRGALLNVLTGGRAVDLNLHHEFGGCWAAVLPALCFPSAVAGRCSAC